MTAAVTIFSTLAFPLGSVLAYDSDTGEESQITVDEDEIINDLESLDPYVTVENNTYVLELPQDVIVNPVLAQEAHNLIEESNKIVANEEAVIDPVTKTATIYGSGVQTFAYKEGVNSVTLHWSHAKINLSKSTVEAVQGGSLGVLGFIGGKLPSVSLQLFAAAVIGTVGTMSPNGGIWVHYNYLSLVGIHSFTEWGYQ